MATFCGPIFWTTLYLYARLPLNGDKWFVCTAYEVLSDKEKRRQYDQFGDGSFAGSTHNANFHDIFRSSGFDDDDDDLFSFSGRRSSHFPRGSAFHFDSAFDDFQMPGFDFDSFHRQHHENVHRNAHQFHEQHRNMHRAAHNTAQHQSATFHQHSSGKCRLVSYSLYSTVCRPFRQWYIYKTNEKFKK